MLEKIDDTWIVKTKNTPKKIIVSVERKEHSSEGPVMTFTLNKCYKDGDAINDWEFEGYLTSTDYDRGKVEITAKDSEDEDVTLLDQEFETQTASDE
jgi:hypothetical protein